MLLTSLSDPQDVIKGLQAGADNFLTKPYEDTFLISCIQNIFANQELRKSRILVQKLRSCLRVRNTSSILTECK